MLRTFLIAVHSRPSIHSAFGDVFYKESDTNFAEYVFGSREITPSNVVPFNTRMAPYYRFIKTAPYLNAEPEITRHERTNDDRFLVVASDGLWAIPEVTNKWVVETAQSGLDKGANPADHLMEEISRFNPGDDITIKVVVFANGILK